MAFIVSLPLIVKLGILALLLFFVLYIFHSFKKWANAEEIEKKLRDDNNYKNDIDKKE